MRLRTRFGLLSAFLAIAVLSATAVPRATGGNEGVIVGVVDTGNGDGFQLYAINPEHPNPPVQLTHLAFNPNFFFYSPHFSRDGKRIVFLYQSPSEPGPNVYIMNSDGSHLRKVTTDNSAVSASFSADGNRLLVASAHTKTLLPAIISIVADGDGSQRVLTNDLFSYVDPSTTPNGRKIVYGTQDGGVVSITASMNADGSDKRRLSEAEDQLCPANVSPDGLKVLLNSFCNVDVKNQNIWVMNVDGTGVRQLTNPGPSITDLAGAYSPDGTKIVFSSTRAGNPNGFDCWVMNADGTGAKLLVRTCGLPAWGPKVVAQSGV